MNIVMLGPPGSGKGTQAQYLVKRFGLVHISTGDLFREILKNPDHPLYQEVRVVNEGKLVSDDVTNRVVENAIEKLKDSKGIIFDGYPRTISQAQALDRMMSSVNMKVDVVLDLNVTQEVILYRLLGRRICPNCRKIYHVNDGYTQCPDCKVPLRVRDDDNEETIVKRLKEYNEWAAHLKDYYSKSNSVYISLTIDDVSKTSQEVQEEVIQEFSKRGLV
ncbi:MAG: nucleoside monophosphate kinase [Clostridiales bacterium]|nr:nucleoside monophosphate kinase [Clostridiales bacterium]